MIHIEIVSTHTLCSPDQNTQRSALSFPTVWVASSVMRTLFIPMGMDTEKNFNVNGPQKISRPAKL